KSSNVNDINAILPNLPQNHRSLVLNLEVPIHDANRKQQLIKANIELKQAKIALENLKQQLIAAVLNTYQQIKMQELQIALVDKALLFADRSVVIAKKKLQYGRATVFEVTSLQQNLAAQRLACISARISYLNMI